MISATSLSALKTSSFLDAPLKLFKPPALWMAQRYRSASLRFKITFFVVILLTGTSTILSIITIQIMNNYILNEIIKRGESVGKSIAASAGYNLLPEDPLGLANLVFKAKSSNSDMLYVAIVDTDMRTIVHSDIGKKWESKPVAQGLLYREAADGTIVKELPYSLGSIFEIICPIVFMKKSLGSVIIGMDRSIPMEAQQKVRNMILIVFGFIVVLGICMSLVLTYFLIKPIKELSAGVEELKYGTAKNPLRIYSQDELGKLTRDFNEMAALIADQQGKLTEYTRDLEEAYVSIVKVVAAAIDARDSYTHGHSARVAQVSLLIGKRTGLSEEDLRDLEVACLFHDVGKIKTPDSILLKPGKLDEDERKKMRQHVIDGTSILSWAPSLSKYIPSTRHHHEWHNGKGYPDGLGGDDIPLFAAIMSIADAFDAMTSDRPYRKALFKEEALSRIARMSGIQFRPDLVAIFLEMMKKGLVQVRPLYAVSNFVST
jgi:HD-GYP domain-containing protein (c-di-GMP phosphodiesterase class II)